MGSTCWKVALEALRALATWLATGRNVPSLILATHTFFHPLLLRLGHPHAQVPTLCRRPLPFDVVLALAWLADPG
jgi:hypothetical protein